MKKFIVLLLAALMVVGLCISCKEPDPKDELYGKWVYEDEEDKVIGMVTTSIIDDDWLYIGEIFLEKEGNNSLKRILKTKLYT